MASQTKTVLLNFFRISRKTLHPLILIVFLLVMPGCGFGDGGSVVKTLPGFDGTLPFTLETGYVGVGTKEAVQLFYYFVESQNDPLQDPLLLWISGGPGCSALGAFLFESGPLTLNVREYDHDGSLPTLELNPRTWTKGLNIIYLDAPVGAGFSYSTSEEGYDVGDYKLVAHVCQFLLEWLTEHPKFLQNQLYISGEGYSGNHIPIIVQEILKGNEIGRLPALNLKGYVIGNPGTDKFIDFNSRIPFAHRLTLISDELYESAKTNCNDDFVSDNRSAECASDIDAINELISRINMVQIYEPLCSNMLPKPSDGNSARRYLKDKSASFLTYQPDGHEKFWCLEYNQVVSSIWANDKNVQDALHVRNVPNNTWEYCNDTLNQIYDKQVSSVVDYYRNLSNTNLRVLLYSGDVDMSIPHIGTQKWIKSLNLTLDESWRAWSVNDQTAGYTRKFKKDDFNLTFATVKGAGHFAAEHKIIECSAMIQRWISYSPL